MGGHAVLHGQRRMEAAHPVFESRIQADPPLDGRYCEQFPNREPTVSARVVGDHLVDSLEPPTPRPLGLGRISRRSFGE